MTPQLSIIIASYNAEKTIESCLESLENQATDKDFEVIVVDSSPDGTAKLIEERFPDVNLYRFSERKFPGDARNFGISISNCKIIAFIDTDCVADRNWVNEILMAHERPYPVIGGAIENGNPDSYIGWAVYFCEFSQWMPQLQKCFMVEIPTCCLSLKRWVFDKYGQFLEGTYCEDTALHWRLGKYNLKPLFIPSVKVAHTNVNSLRLFVRKELIHGRYFSKVRVLEQELSMLKRIVFVLLSPILPFLLFSRVAKRVLRNKIYFKQFIFVSPLVFFGLIVWSCGEFVGYLSKPKKV